MFGCRRRRSSASRSSLRIRRKHLEGEAQPLCFHGNPPPHPPPSVCVNLLEDFFRLVISGDVTHRQDVLPSTYSDAKSQPMHTLLHVWLFENFFFCFSIDSFEASNPEKIISKNHFCCDNTHHPFSHRRQPAVHPNQPTTPHSGLLKEQNSPESRVQKKNKLVRLSAL